MGAVQDSVFRNVVIDNNGKSVPLPKVVIEVRYKDKTGQWNKETASITTFSRRIMNSLLGWRDRRSRKDDDPMDLQEAFEIYYELLGDPQADQLLRDDVSSAAIIEGNWRRLQWERLDRCPDRPPSAVDVEHFCAKSTD